MVHSVLVVLFLLQDTNVMSLIHYNSLNTLTLAGPVLQCGTQCPGCVVLVTRYQRHVIDTLQLFEHISPCWCSVVHSVLVVLFLLQDTNVMSLIHYNSLNTLTLAGAVLQCGTPCPGCVVLVTRYQRHVIDTLQLFEHISPCWCSPPVWYTVSWLCCSCYKIPTSCH